MPNPGCPICTVAMSLIEWYGSTSYYLCPTCHTKFMTYGQLCIPIIPNHIVGDLTAGAADIISFYWENPNPHKLAIMRSILYLKTAGGTATAVINIGTAANATTGSDNLIDGLDINTTGLFDNINEAGTNGKSRQLLDEHGGTTSFVTGQIKTEKADNLVGKYILEYERLV